MGRVALTSTYRVQLNAAFGFDAARAVVPYLARLGVSHLYCSPVLAARTGSRHGYDVVDPSRANPELGGEAGLRALADELHAHGMGLVLDIVPNHMGAGRENPYWTDVLTWGRESQYARWFDLDWAAEGAARGGRIVLAVLGDELEAVIARGELSVELRDGRFVVVYFDRAYPVDPRTVHRLFAFEHRFEFPTGAGVAEALLRVRAALAPEGGASLGREEAEGAVAALAALAAESAAVREYVRATLVAFAAGEAGHYRLRALVDFQAWALAFWRTGLRDVNYRRFFDVNDLLGVRAEDPAVFDATHARVLEWVADGVVDAVRVDHIDGLRDPLAYLRRLRAELDARRPGEAVPIFVEKILTHGERLREEWPVDGTTGYEFATTLEPAYVDPAGYDAVEAAYRQLLRIRSRGGEFAEVARRGKELVLRRALEPDVRRLVRLLDPIARAAGAGLTRAQLGEAVVQLLRATPVYRTYVRAEAVEAGGTLATRWTVGDEDRAVVGQALERAIGQGAAAAEALRFAARALVGDALPQDALEVPRAPRRAPRTDLAAAARGFALRFQQTSGPAMAKGVEDTALYRWFPVASLCEVGGEPARPPDDAVARLHAASRERLARWPLSMLAATTHDTKRSADVRARLDALTELPGEWRTLVARWRARHAALRTRVGDRSSPDANTEYLLYQTLVGVWPLGPEPDGAAREALLERVTRYLEKATREAKAHTSWTDPNAAVEGAAARFVRALVVEDAGAEFRRELARLLERVGPAGMWTALSRVAVQLTSPGTPDTYQGDDLWLLALVDPDNRGPVDFAARAAALDALSSSGDRPAADCDALVAAAADGRVKLHVLHRLLLARRADPELFARGAYVPLAASGPGARHVIAFARVLDGRAAITIAPRLPLLLCPDGAPPLGEGAWGDTAVELPGELGGGAGSGLRDALGGAGALLAAPDGRLRVADALRRLPVALVLR